MEKKYFITYMVPVTLRLTDHVVPKAEEVIAALVKTARKMIMEKDYYPVHIEEAYEVISEDEVRQNEILGDIDRRPEADNDVGTTGGKDPDHGESVPSDERGESISDDAGAASKVGDEGKDSTKDEGRLQQEQTK